MGKNQETVDWEAKWEVQEGQRKQQVKRLLENWKAPGFHSGPFHWETAATHGKFISAMQWKREQMRSKNTGSEAQSQGVIRVEGAQLTSRGEALSTGQG